MIPIHVRDVEKSFGATAALRGTCLNVQQGSIYGLLGRNGAGKTTLLKILIGLVRADSGTAEVLERSLSDGAAEEKRDVAYVAQGELLPSWATIGDLMRFDAAVRPDWHPESLLRWMTEEGIRQNRKIGSLSGG